MSPNTFVDVDRARLDQQLHDTGWGLLLVITGAVWLVPADRVPEGAWLLGVAVILLGLNVVRLCNQLKVNGFSLMLGFMALLAALTRLWRQDLPLLAICLVIIGVSLVAKPWLAGSGEGHGSMPRTS